MNKFSNGKIYILTGSDKYYYIGSTITELRYRLNKHKGDAKIKDTYAYKHFNKLGWDNVKIELLEKYPCNSKEELIIKENEYIIIAKCDNNCLNRNNSYMTEEDKIEWKRQYRQDNKEQIKEYNKNYVVNHKEIVEQKQKEYREANKEKLKEYFKKYAAENKEEKKEYKKKYVAENRDLITKKSKEFRENNKDKITAKGKKYFQENRDELIKKMKEYREKDPEKTRARHAKYLENRRQKLKEIGTISHQCECGGKYTDKHKDRHAASKKHARFLDTPCRN
jgi:hypothetical protein